MRPCVVVIFFLTLTLQTFGQNEMETSCVRRIKEISANIHFPRFTGLISVSKDTIRFDSSAIIVSDTNADLLKVFELGIVFPDLIYGASTMGDKYEFRKTFNTDLLTISGLSELHFPNQKPNIRCFKFLLWYKMMANPSLYVFELTNDEATSSTPMKTFVEKAKVTAFGFCTILI